MDKKSIIGYIESLAEHPKGKFELLQAAQDVFEIAEYALGFFHLEQTKVLLNSSKIVEQKNKLQKEVAEKRKLWQESELQRNEYQAFLTEEQSLLEAEKDFHAKSEKIQKLKELKEYIDTIDFVELDLEFEQTTTTLNLSLELFKEKLAQLESVLKNANVQAVEEIPNLTQSITQHLADVERNIEEGERTLKASTMKLFSIFKNEEERLNKLLVEFNTLFTKLLEIKETLISVEKAHKTNFETFLAHFSSNQEIYGKIGEKHHINDYVERLTTQIKDGLKDFDQSIKSILEKINEMQIHEI